MVSALQAPDAALQLPQGNVREPGDFPEDEFLTIENVPVFAEHETKASDGREIKFGYQELKLVADRCNRRIAESGDYAAITIGHTPGPEAKAAGAADPDLVGFAGPYRMGLIGQPGSRQRHAILADFHIYRDEVTRFKRHPRRSPELWLEDRYEEMFLDPIALLGAEAPRLDLGLLYSASLHRGNRRVCLEKYAAVAPGPGNVFVPGEETRCYSPAASEGSVMDANDNLVAEICEAIGQTDEMQFIRKLMAEQSGDVAGGELASEDPSPSLDATPAAVDPAPAPPVPPPAAPPADPAPATPPAATADSTPAAPPADQEAEKLRKRRYEALDELDDDELEQYMAQRKKRRYEADGDEEDELFDDELDYQADGSADGSETIAAGVVDGQDDSAGNGPVSYSRARNGQAHKLNYQRLQMELRKQSDRSNQLSRELRVERSARINAERYQRLQNLQLSGYALDPDREITRLGSDRLDSEQFDEAITAITENYQRMPTLELPYSRNASMGDPSRPGSHAEQERYSRVCADRAQAICMDQINQGLQPDFVTVLNEVKSGKHGDVA